MTIDLGSDFAKGWVCGRDTYSERRNQHVLTDATRTLAEGFNDIVWVNATPAAVWAFNRCLCDQSASKAFPTIRPPFPSTAIYVKTSVDCSTPGCTSVHPKELCYWVVDFPEKVVVTFWTVIADNRLLYWGAASVDVEKDRGRPTGGLVFKADTEGCMPTGSGDPGWATTLEVANEKHLWWALTLLTLFHVKGVGTTSVAPKTKRPIFRKDRLTRWLRFSLITVPGWMEAPADHGAVDSQQSGVCRHLCRGHFATHERFFGRDEKRVVWVPAHFRGMEEIGESIQTRVVVSPEPRA